MIIAHSTTPRIIQFRTKCADVELNTSPKTLRDLTPPIPVEPPDLQASEREILLANVLDYFSDLKEAQIEAMIPNLIKFISGRDPKNSVVINEDADGTFSIYEESGQCIEFGFESKDEAKDYAVDNHMVVVDNFNL
jgi:hypothetical protein